jgi:L-ascorbate metabolism protein UlaG (beta-lactamase superfamily)
MNHLRSSVRPFRLVAAIILLLLGLGSRDLCAAEPALSGDRIAAVGGDLIVHPINHATLALAFSNVVVYVDPVGGETRFAGLPRPTLILITDIHGDHLNLDTLKAVAGTKAALAVSPAVAEKLPAELRARASVLTNGAKATVGGVGIEAVPAYNTTTDRLNFHAKGRGNGYLIELGGQRIYISGDTEDIPEMRALRDVDLAFLCMNLPYTMTVEQAADAVRAFKPRIVYPYHSRGSDLEKFQKQVGAASDVRLRDWYGQ